MFLTEPQRGPVPLSSPTSHSAGTRPTALLACRGHKCQLVLFFHILLQKNNTKKIKMIQPSGSVMTVGRLASRKVKEAPKRKGVPRGGLSPEAGIFMARLFGQCCGCSLQCAITALQLQSA